MLFNKLKGKMVSEGLSAEETSKQIGLHRSTLYRKMRGECQFTVGEAAGLMKILKLTPEEAIDIFFENDVVEKIHRLKGESK